MFRDLYLVYTGNDFNQVLLFRSFADADQYLRQETRLTKEERKRRIRKPSVIGNMGFVFEAK